MESHHEHQPARHEKNSGMRPRIQGLLLVNHGWESAEELRSWAKRGTGTPAKSFPGHKSGKVIVPLRVDDRPGGVSAS